MLTPELSKVDGRPLLTIWAEDEKGRKVETVMTLDEWDELHSRVCELRTQAEG